MFCLLVHSAGKGKVQKQKDSGLKTLEAIQLEDVVQIGERSLLRGVIQGLSLLPRGCQVETWVTPSSEFQLAGRE